VNVGIEFVNFICALV